MLLFALVELVNFFRCKGKFGDNVRIAGVAVERICGGGNIVAVFLTETVEIILDMEAVHALGRTVNVIILTAIVAVNSEAVFKAVAYLGLAQRYKTIAAGEGINIHFLFVAVCAVDNLLTNRMDLAAQWRRKQ